MYLTYSRDCSRRGTMYCLYRISRHTANLLHNGRRAGELGLDWDISVGIGYILMGQTKRLHTRINSDITHITSVIVIHCLPLVVVLTKFMNGF